MHKIRVSDTHGIVAVRDSDRYWSVVSLHCVNLHKSQQTLDWPGSDPSPVSPCVAMERTRTDGAIRLQSHLVNVCLGTPLGVCHVSAELVVAVVRTHAANGTGGGGGAQRRNLVPQKFAGARPRVNIALQTRVKEILEDWRQLVLVFDVGFSSHGHEIVHCASRGFSLARGEGTLGLAPDHVNSNDAQRLGHVWHWRLSCAVGAPVGPRLTLATPCGTLVSSSLGLARLPQ